MDPAHAIMLPRWTYGGRGTPAPYANQYVVSVPARACLVCLLIARPRACGGPESSKHSKRPLETRSASRAVAHVHEPNSRCAPASFVMPLLALGGYDRTGALEPRAGTASQEVIGMLHESLRMSLERGKEGTIASRTQS
jgi:hypothetical protein